MHIVFSVAHGGNCTEHIVRLPALAFDDRKAHGGGDLFCPWQLDRQILGHWLSRRLIAVVHFVAECRCLQIEGAGKIVGRKAVKMLLQYGNKAVYGVCGRSVSRGQRADAVKGAVENTVAVNY